MTGKKRKFDSFANYILNDDDFVMPFLTILSHIVGILIIFLLLYIGIRGRIWFLIIIGGVMLYAFGLRMYRFYFVFGGVKNMKGMRAGNMIWNPDGVTVIKKNKTKRGKNDNNR